MLQSIKDDFTPPGWNHSISSILYQNKIQMPPFKALYQKSWIYSPLDKSSLLSHFVNKVLLEQSHTYLYMYCLGLLSTIDWLSSCDRDPRSSKGWNVYYFALYRKCFLTITLYYWCWSSNTLATWCKVPTHWKRPWCWERLRAGGERDDRGWDGWMTSPTQQTWVEQTLGDRQGYCAAVHGVGKSQTRPSDWTTTISHMLIFPTYPSLTKSHSCLYSYHQKQLFLPLECVGPTI